MKTNTDRLLSLSVFMAVLGASVVFCQRFPTAIINVAVGDELGSPVVDAEVGIAGTLEPRQGEAVKGTTDQAGTFTTAITTNGDIGLTVQKPGYYRTQLAFAYSFPNKWRVLESKAGHWAERPNIHVTLKQIMQPVAMYVRRLNRGIPVKSERIGFDLFTGDFVSPYGRGQSSDIFFRSDAIDRRKNDYDYTIAVSFPNQFDGIIPFVPESYLNGSNLRSPYTAPDVGYQTNWILKRSRRPGEPEKSNGDTQKHGYFFRIRSVTDSSGKIVSANYGKIYGDFMNFTYYLNPTPNDRNIEFDPKRNLFTNLKPDERVTEP